MEKAIGKRLKRDMGVDSELNTMDKLMALLNAEGRLMTPKMLSSVAARMDSLGPRVDIGYIKTIIFPENNFSDIPQPLSSISFSRFSHKDEAIISTGPAGQGMMLWFPRVVSGPSLFVYYPAQAQTTLTMPVPPNTFAAFPVAGGAPKTNTPNNNLRCGFQYDYEPYFTSAALVAASLQIQYIGTMDNESGIMIGGQLYGIPWSKITSTEIENSQWFTKGRPSEGLRFIHLPYDSSDFDYFSINTSSIATTGDPQSYTYAQNQGGSVSHPNEIMYQLGQTLNLDGLSYSNPFGNFAAAPAAVASPKYYMYSENANCVAIYWTGLQVNSQWLRLDAIRRFNGTPFASVRDIVDLTRPKKSFDAKKTFEVVNQLCANSPIGASTMREMDKIVDQLEENLPNIAYIQANGGLQKVDTMGQLAQQLSIDNSEEKQLAGPVGGLGGRVYPF